MVRLSRLHPGYNVDNVDEFLDKTAAAWRAEGR